MRRKKQEAWTIMLISLALTLLSQHPVPIEPDAMSKSWALGVADSDGYYQTSELWLTQRMGFTVDDTDVADYQADFANWEQSYTYPQLPVLVVWVKDEPHFVVAKEHEMHFYTYWLQCPACYTYHTLDDDFGQCVKAEVKDPRYIAYVVHRNLWPTRHLTYAELAGKDHIFKTPWQLRYKLLRLQMGDNKKPASTVPLWVRMKLSDNKNWINRASRALGDLTWEQFYARHGYIPGDRSPADMQYNFALRAGMPWSERLRRETPPCEPEFGERGHGPGGRYTACTEALYEAEMQATRNERDWATQLVERYLGE